MTDVSVTIQETPLAVVVDTGTPKVTITEQATGKVTVTQAAPVTIAAASGSPRIFVNNGGVGSVPAMLESLIGKLTRTHMDPSLASDLVKLQSLWLRIGNELILTYTDGLSIQEAERSYTNAQIQDLTDDISSLQATLRNYTDNQVLNLTGAINSLHEILRTYTDNQILSTFDTINGTQVELRNYIDSQILEADGNAINREEALRTYTDNQILDIVSNVNVSVDGKVTIAFSSVDQKADSIDQRVTQIKGDTDNRMLVAESRILQTEQSITQTVSRLDTINGPGGAVEVLQSAITQTANSVSLEASRRQQVADDLVEARSTISVLTDTITLMATTLNVINGWKTDTTILLGEDGIEFTVLQTMLNDSAYSIGVVQSLLANKWGVEIAEDVNGNKYAAGFSLLLHPIWLSGQAYIVGDTVAVDASVYRCIVSHTANAENSPTGTAGTTYWLLLPEGVKSSFIVRADQFAVMGPDGSGALMPFTVDIVDGQAVVGIHGQLIVGGSIPFNALSDEAQTTIDNSISAAEAQALLDAKAYTEGWSAHGADVTNYNDYRVSNVMVGGSYITTIARPVGGTFTQQATPVTGVIKITLPQSWTNTVLTFDIGIVNYALTNDTSPGMGFLLRVGGYTASASTQWARAFAQLIGSAMANNRVRFGHDGSKCCILIGDVDSVWSYPAISVSNAQASYSNTSRETWETGWAVSIVTNISGITVSKDISDALIDAKSILGQGALATQDETDWSTQVTGAGKPADNADVTDYSIIYSTAQGYADTAETQATANAQAYADGKFVTQVLYQEEINNLQNQLDGQVVAWFYNYAPTATNAPASLWTTEALKDEHANDTFTHLTTGQSWRWVHDAGVWKWLEIADTAATAALALAAQAKDIADNKRRVFTAQPTVPYDIGDLWADGSTLLRCVTAKTSTGSYVAGDWVAVADKTDYTKAETFPAVVTPNLMKRTGSTFEKTSGSNAWGEAQAYSTQGYTGGCRLAFRAGAVDKFLMLGLGQTPTVNAYYNSADYLFYLINERLAYFWEKATSTVTTQLAYTTSTLFEIIYDGSAVRYYMDGVVVREVTGLASNLTFYMDSSFLSIGAKVTHVQWGPYSPTLAAVQAQAELAKIAAKAYADGKVTAEEQRAIADAKAKADAAQAAAEVNAETFPVVITNGYMRRSGSTFERIGGVSNWDAQAYSVQGYTGGCRLSFRAAAATAVRVGLATSPHTDAGVSSINYCFSISMAGVFKIFEAGVSVFSGTAVDSTTIFELTYNGSELKYLVGGAVVKTTAGLGSNLTFYMDSSFFNVGAKITHVQWGPYAPPLSVVQAQANLARVTAEAYADGKVTAAEQRAIAEAQAKANLAETVAKAYADGIVLSAEQRVITEAQTKADLAETVAKAYADEIVTAEEQRAIADAQAKADAARDAARDAAETYADGIVSSAEQRAIAEAQTKANLAETTAKAYADGVVTAAEQRAITDAQTKANLAEVTAKAYADEIVTAEEQRAIADARSKALMGHNLLNWYESWTPGTGNTGQFLRSSIDAESIRAYAVGPFGQREIVWQSIPSGDGVTDGGFTTADGFSVNPDKTYIFGCYVQRLTGNGVLYFGCNQVQSLAGVVNSNPYFVSTSISNSAKWMLAIGVIHSRGYTGPDTGLSGFYDVETGVKLFAGTDYKIDNTLADPTVQKIRAFQYASTTGNGTTVEVQFARPFVMEASVCPPIEQLTGKLSTIAAGADVTSQNQSAGVTGQEIYRVSGHSYQCTNYPASSGIRNESGTLFSTVGNCARSYMLAVYDRATRTWGSPTRFDIHADSANALALANALASLDSSKIVVIIGEHAPDHNRLTNGLPAQIYRCGGSKTIFERANWTAGTSAYPMYPTYILVGVPGMGEGAGIEHFASGAIGWLDIQFIVKNGSLVLPGATPDADLTDYTATQAQANVAQTAAETNAETFPVVITSSLMKRSGSTFQKISGAAAADAQAYSVQGHTGGCRLAFRTGAVNKILFLGIGQNPTAGTGYISIDYQFHTQSSGVVGIYEKTSAVNIGNPAYTTSTLFEIIYDGSEVRYLMNGVVKRTVTGLASNLTFYMDSSFYDVGSKVTHVQWGPYSPSLSVVQAQANLARVNAEAYADGKITAAEQRAIAEAEAKAVLAETTAKAYADGLVTAEEQRAIADAQAKANAAQAAAKAYADTTFVTAALHATDIAGVQSQIDGQVIAWFYAYVPTTANVPASLWTTEALKDQHANDTFTHLTTGQAWRWAYAAGAWKWVEILDTATKSALAAAGAAQATANSKRRVFVVQPTGPYDIGDLWTSGTTLRRCVTAKAVGGSYAAGDWEIAANNTTNTNQLTDGANLGGTATWSGVTGTGKPASNADVTSTVIGAGLITTGYIGNAVKTANPTLGIDFNAAEIIVGAAAGLKVKSGGGIIIEAGGDLKFIASGTNRSRIFFYNGASDTTPIEISVDYTRRLNIIPGEPTSARQIHIGNGSSVWKECKIRCETFQACFGNVLHDYQYLLMQDDRVVLQACDAVSGECGTLTMSGSLGVDLRAAGASLILSTTNKAEITADKITISGSVGTYIKAPVRTAVPTSAEVLEGHVMIYTEGILTKLAANINGVIYVRTL